MTAVLILGAVCIVEGAVLFTLAWVIDRCVREHTKLARAFARSKAPNYVFSEKDELKRSSGSRHVTLSERQNHTPVGKSGSAG